MFQENWTQPYNDEAQVAPWNATRLLLGDYRKNIRNVAIFVDKDNAESFQLVLVTSDEAVELQHFCKHPRVEDIMESYKSFHWNDGSYKRVSKTTKCEDIKRQKSFHDTLKKIDHRLDIWQQIALYTNTNDTRAFLRNYWASHRCMVFTPTSLGEHFLDKLLGTQRHQNRAAKIKLLKVLVEVLALAGSQEVVEHPYLKAEFVTRMQETFFRDSYRQVREKMGEPVDAVDLSYFTSYARKCEKECPTGIYSFKSKLVADETKIWCKCRPVGWFETTTTTVTITTTHTSTTSTPIDGPKCRNGCEPRHCSKTSFKYEQCLDCAMCKYPPRRYQCAGFCLSGTSYLKECRGCDGTRVTATCGKYYDCDYKDPEKYCHGWRKEFCGGCGFCAGES